MAGWKTRPPFLDLLAGHNRPADGLGVFEDPGLDGLVFSGLSHGSACSQNVTERGELFGNRATSADQISDEALVDI